jgi:hypothetical protein
MSMWKILNINELAISIEFDMTLVFLDTFDNYLLENSIHF